MTQLEAARKGLVTDAMKTVAINLGTCRGGVFVEVADQGSGFDYEGFGSVESLEKGSGIFVMKTLANRMSYSDGGRMVRMEFDIAGIDPADALERASVLQAHFALVAA